MVGIFKIYGGKCLVGVANNWEDFLKYKKNLWIKKDPANYGRWSLEDVEIFMKDNGFWAEPLENFSEYLEG